MQSIGFIPLMSAMVHPNAPLCSFKTSNNLPFCSSFKDDEMITGRVFYSPKNAYSKVLGNGLSSSFGGDSNDEMSFFSDGASFSTIDFYLLVSMDDAESSRALTSSTDMSISKSKPK